MERSTCLGTSALVDEIISDALQKMESGDLLPASEESSLSILHGGNPVARSTSIANIPGLRGYRSFTDDVIKSFMDRDSRFGVKPEKSDSENTSSSNPFEGFSENMQFESSGEFVSGEKLLNEFEEDEQRCREENLFKENRPVPVECASIAESPEKLSRKQVSPPEWAKNSPQLDSFSYFSGQQKDMTFGADVSASNSDGTLYQTRSNLQEKSDVTEVTESYNIGLPYRLGIVLPGVSTNFDLLRPVAACSKSVLLTKSSLNGKPLPLCKTKLTAKHLNLVLTPPPDCVGEILIQLDLLPDISILLSAYCMAPAFSLPPRICVPPAVRSSVPMKLASAFPVPLELDVRSDLVQTTRISLTPGVNSFPLELTATSGETSLQITLLYRGQEFTTIRSDLEVRKLKIAMQLKTEGSNSSLVITNSENFPVEVKLSDDSGARLSYMSVIGLMEGQTIVKSMKSFTMAQGHPELLVTFSLDLISPIRAPLPCQCTHRFPSSLADLRPNLPRFLWLADDEIEFSMVDHLTNKPQAWKDRVVISPCPLIDRYIKVVEEPSDPTKIILRVTKPPQLAFGRLKFYRRGADGKPSGTPYGFRYPLIVPEKPQLRWHTVSENASSNIYQIPIDGKLRVTNTIAHDVFLITQDMETVLPGKKSIELTIRQPCKIYSGLESWRQIVKAKTNKYLDQIRDAPQTDLDPFRMLGDFQSQNSVPLDRRHLDVIPSDPQSSARLYQLFEGTVDSITLRHAAENGTFFAPSRT